MQKLKSEVGWKQTDELLTDTTEFVTFLADVVGESMLNGV